MTALFLLCAATGALALGGLVGLVGWAAWVSFRDRHLPQNNHPFYRR